MISRFLSLDCCLLNPSSWLNLCGLMRSVGGVFPSFLSTGLQKHQSVNVPVGQPHIKVLNELELNPVPICPL